MPWRHGPLNPPVRNPFEVAAGAFYIAVGIVGMAGFVTPSVETVLVGPIMLIWLIGATLAGSAMLLAAVMVHKDLAMSLLLERVGLRGIVLFSMYLWVITIVFARQNVSGLIFLTFYMVAAIVRHVEVSRSIQWLHEQTQQVTGGESSA